MLGQQTGIGKGGYVRKDTSQLGCACSEYAARYAIWASSLARVNMFKCLAHVGHGGGEPTVLGSGLHRWHCIILEVGKEGV